MEYGLIIDGKEIKTGNVEEIKNPFSGEVVGIVHKGGKEDINKGIECCLKSFSFFSTLPSYVKSEYLLKISAIIKQRREEIARLIAMEAGKPLKLARVECDRASLTFKLASEEAVRFGGEMLPLDIIRGNEAYFAITKRFPVGALGAISPYNFPLNLSAHKVAPSLAVGNSVILKPPSPCPITGLTLGKIALEAGLPDGVFNVIACPASIGEMIVRDERIKIVSFTGSTEVGWYLKSIAGKKRILLELGGNAGVIVEPDANLSFAIPRIAFGSFAHAGQICISIQRIYVHESIYEEFLEHFIEETKKIKVGDPLDEETIVGPMINDKEATRAFSWIEEAKRGGAKILTGGERDGNIIFPTIITDFKKDMKVFTHEVFAPVVVIAKYSSFNEALCEVNDSSYGLQAGVFTKDIYKAIRAFESLEVGGVIINDYPTFRSDNYPYGGVKDSGLGREGVKYAMEEMSELKTLVIRSR